MKRNLILVLLVLWCGVPGCGRLLAQQVAAIARLSSVQGKVQILEDGTVLFDQAQANMPITAGNRLQTGADGRAEIEFTDGSVARLTPNSSLQILRLPGASIGHNSTEVQQLTGLVYFELNVSEGQRYTVRFASGTARPTDNSIFRIDLDNTPELAVLEGAVHVSGGGVFEEDVPANQTLHLNAETSSGYTLSAGVRRESWDRWNADRDGQIARMAENQTEARNLSDDANGPGWNDLDYYGNWYPVEGYGNVWVPGYTDGTFDPYGNGYWASYPGWGFTWISAYPWGWLPYHCGAWNYFDAVGWGWIPGECGLGWIPVGAIWNTPPGFRLPPKPILDGHMGPARLVAVNRGSGAGRNGQNVRPEHTRPIRLDGQTIPPLPLVRSPWLPQHGEAPGRLASRPDHVGVPRPPSTGNAVRSGVFVPGRPAAPPSVQPMGMEPHPTYMPRPIAPPPMVTPRPMETRPMAPPPAAPHISAPPPAPHAPAPAGPPGR